MSGEQVPEWSRIQRLIRFSAGVLLAILLLAGLLLVFRISQKYYIVAGMKAKGCQFTYDGQPDWMPIAAASLRTLLPGTKVSEP